MMTGKNVISSVPNGPPEQSYLSPAIRVGNLIYVSGHAGLLPGHPAHGSGAQWVPGDVIQGGIEAETRQTIENISAVLQAAGASLENVVKVNTFLRDVDRDFAAYNGVYQTFFKSNPPTRTTVGAKIYGNLLIEMECVAVLPD